MKKLLNIGLVLCSLAASVPAFAEEEFDFQKACRITGNMAESMMTARQAGVPLDKAMAKLMEIYPAGNLLLLDAYKQPIWNTKKYQDRAIADFKNNTLIQCYGLISK